MTTTPDTSTTTETSLHPWLSTPEATEAARKAAQVPFAFMLRLANRAGTDTLEAQALVILAECALQPRDQAPDVCGQCHSSLDDDREDAFFCSRECRNHYAIGVQRFRDGRMPEAIATPAHIGSMWSWPEGERQKYAVKTVGYALNNWLRTRHKPL